MQQARGKSRCPGLASSQPLGHAGPGRPRAVIEGIVRSWDDVAGWGVLASPDVPGEVFAHFSHIDAVGYRSLVEGERVRFNCEPYPPGQDRYFFRATRVVRLSH